MTWIRVLQAQRNLRIQEQPSDSVIWLSSCPCQCEAFVPSDPRGRQANPSTSLFSPFPLPSPSLSSDPLTVLPAMISQLSLGDSSLKDSLSQTPWQVTEMGRMLGSEPHDKVIRSFKSPALQPFLLLQYWVIEHLILLTSTSWRRWVKLKKKTTKKTILPYRDSS